MSSITNGRGIRAAALVASLLGASGCSVYMEATRPTPVDLAQFHAEQTRDEVVERLGTPQGEVTESNHYACDLYQLYTHGYGAGGKIPIAILEGAADVFTVGLAEVITSPVEGATKNQTHAVSFCYRNDRLQRVSEDGHEIAPITPASASSAAAQSTVPAPTSAAAAQDVPLTSAQRGLSVAQ